MIKGRAHTRQEAFVTNFAARLPDSQSEMARQPLTDPKVVADAGIKPE